MVVVLVCGGGNGAHTLAGIAASKPNTESRVISLFADEAERWNNIAKDNDFTVNVHSETGDDKTLKSKPKIVTKDPAVAVPGSDIIVFVVPAFAHAQYLEELKPHIKPGTIVVGMPGHAGFEFAVRGIWGDLAKACTIMTFESLPWACRIKEFAKCVEVLGTKGALNGGVDIGSVAPKEDPVAMLQNILGDFPKLKTSGHLLGVTLMAADGAHPSMLYGRWRNWDGKPVDIAPLIYQGLDQFTADTLSACSDEMMAAAKAIMQQRPGVDLSNVEHIYQWYLRCYDRQIADKSCLLTCYTTNSAYTGLTHPVKKTDDGKFMPDFSARYLAEDVPFGLVVNRGIATIAGVKTPTLDTVITWAQAKLGKEFLVDGELKGKDMNLSRAPQRYGLDTLDKLIGAK